ncbi:hypothetical protein CYY_005992 [Polysphondylium violaceum]|uniref:EGF-like domain-containing protein n=1 Tax=Polysphondylium violaceum TaxID=133409 RepID=A0A8J4Q1E3_9MYCE|nr:hypothetical protein CYY_005992 [Polysphondylium violaceum]
MNYHNNLYYILFILYLAIGVFGAPTVFKNITNPNQNNYYPDSSSTSCTAYYEVIIQYNSTFNNFIKSETDNPLLSGFDKIYQSNGKALCALEYNIPLDTVSEITLTIQSGSLKETFSLGNYECTSSPSELTTSLVGSNNKMPYFWSLYFNEVVIKLDNLQKVLPVYVPPQDQDPIFSTNVSSFYTPYLAHYDFYENGYQKYKFFDNYFVIGFNIMGQMSTAGYADYISLVTSTLKAASNSILIRPFDTVTPTYTGSIFYPNAPSNTMRMVYGFTDVSSNKPHFIRFTRDGEPFWSAYNYPVYGNATKYTLFGFHTREIFSRSSFSFSLSFFSTSGTDIRPHSKNYNNYIVENGIDPTNPTFQSYNQKQSLFKTQMTYNFNIPSYIMNSSAILTMRKSIPLEFPFGFASGNLDSLTFSLAIPICQYFPSGSYQAIMQVPDSYYYNEYQNLVSAAGPSGTSTVDEEWPLLNSFEFVYNLGDDLALIRMSVSDVTSGVSTIILNTFRDGEQTYIGVGDLVSGTYKNGVYEKYVPFWYLSNIELITVLDNTLGYWWSKYYDGRIININGDVLHLTPGGEDVMPTPDSIVEFYFEKNPVDVTNKSVDNVLHIKVATVTSNTPYFVPILTFYYDPATNPVNFYGKWNSTTLGYDIPFTIPMNLVSSELIYDLFINPHILCNSGLAPIIGTNASLIVTSDNGDLLGPLISSIQALPATFPVTPSTNVAPFLVTIEDKLNGFSHGEIQITSNYDAIGYKFVFDESSKVSGDALLGSYIFNITLDPETCRSQIYVISQVTLYDKGGYVTSTSIPISYVNPLMKIGASPTLSTICSTVVDTTAPTVYSATLATATTLDVGSLDRTIKVILTSRDTTNTVSTDPRLAPYMYATTAGMIEIPKTQCVFDTIAENVYFKFNCTLTVPFGFGYPFGIYLSIYGIHDTQLNFGGLSSQEISIASIATTYTMNPLLLNASPLDSKQSTLTLYGKHFGTNKSSATLKIDYLNGTTASLPLVYPLFSGSIISSNSLTPTENPFSISITVGTKVSNALLIVPTVITLAPVESSSSSSSPSSSSSETITEVPTQKPTEAPTEKPTQPPVCPKDCSHNGVCTSHGCQCTPPFVGLDCSSRVVIIPEPSVNTTQPNSNTDYDTVLGDKKVRYSSLVSVVSLRELDSQGALVKEFVFEKWVFTNLSDSSYLYQYNITHPADGPIANTSVSVSLQWFSEATNITFANQIITMQPSSLKYKVDLSPYPFTSSFSTLQLVMSASLASSEKESACSSTSFNDDQQELQDQYVKIKVNDHSLYGRFIKRAVIDGGIKAITNTLLDADKNQVKDSSNQGSSAQSFIAINIPFYKNAIVIDPDFSILVETNAAQDDDNSVCTPKAKSGLTKVQMIGIIIGSVGMAVVAIVSVSYFIYKRRSFRKESIKLQTRFARD